MKCNHENTKMGKHEKKRYGYDHFFVFLSFRAFVVTTFEFLFRLVPCTVNRVPASHSSQMKLPFLLSFESRDA